MTAPEHPGTPYFAGLGNVMGEAYLRYSHTKGTEQEVAFLLDELDLEPDMRVLDVGCGPGRLAIPLATAGLKVTGIDVSARFLEVAAARARSAGVSASFFEVDARAMPFDDEFDAVLGICQGAFGLMGADDSLVLRRMMEAARRKGRVAVSAFSAYHEVRAGRDEAVFDFDEGVVYERTTIRDESGTEHDVEMWNSVYTPRELRLLALGCGLVPRAVYAVGPGDYARRSPDADHPELLLVGVKP